MAGFRSNAHADSLGSFSLLMFFPKSLPHFSWTNIEKMTWVDRRSVQWRVSTDPEVSQLLISEARSRAEHIQGPGPLRSISLTESHLHPS